MLIDVCILPGNTPRSSSAPARTTKSRRKPFKNPKSTQSERPKPRGRSAKAKSGSIAPSHNINTRSRACASSVPPKLAGAVSLEDLRQMHHELMEYSAEQWLTHSVPDMEHGKSVGISDVQHI